MATKNVVPRANGEGELGTSSKQWKKVNAQQFTGSIGVSASFFEGDGSRLTNVGGGSSFSVAGDVNNRVITADGSSGGVGEANLTFDGSILTVTGEVSATTFDIGGTNITADATEINKLDGVTATTTELNYLDITTLGTAEASKVVTADASGHITIPHAKELRFDSSDTKIYADTSTHESLFMEADNTIKIRPDNDLYVSYGTTDWVQFDGSANRVGINKVFPSSPPEKTLDIVGDIKATLSSEFGSLDSHSHAFSGSMLVSGSTKFGFDEAHLHQFTGSMNISGALYAGTENPEEHHKFIGTLLVDAAGTNNSELIVDGPNPNYIKLNRNSSTTGFLSTDGSRFTLYGGTTGFAAQIYDGGGDDRGIIDLARASGVITGTKHKLNVSASANAFRVDTDKGTNRFNVQNSTTSFISGSADLITMDNTTVPPTPSNASHIYAKSGEMYVMDTGGNETQISPHDESGEWQYYSRNVKTGKIVRIRMEKMIRALEELTGQTFIEDI